MEAYLDVFNHSQAAKDDKYDFFKDGEKYESISEHKMVCAPFTPSGKANPRDQGIAGVEGDLQEHLKEIAAILRRKVAYVSVSGIEV